MGNCENLFSVLLYIYTISVLCLAPLNMFTTWPSQKKIFDPVLDSEVDQYHIRCLEVKGRG